MRHFEQPPGDVREPPGRMGRLRGGHPRRLGGVRCGRGRFRAGLHRLGVRRNPGRSGRRNPAQPDQHLRGAENGQRVGGFGKGRGGGPRVGGERDAPGPPLRPPRPGPRFRLFRLLHRGCVAPGGTFHGVGVGRHQHGGHPFFGQRMRRPDPGDRSPPLGRRFPLLRSGAGGTDGAGPPGLRRVRFGPGPAGFRSARPPVHAARPGSLRHRHRLSPHFELLERRPTPLRSLLEQFRGEYEASS